MPRAAALLPLTLGLALSAACAPAGDAAPPPVTPAAPNAQNAQNAGAGAKGPEAKGARTPILGPEASAVTIEHISRYPKLGVHLPAKVQFSPDGKLITYLQQAPGSPEMTLFALDPATRATKTLLRASDLQKETKPLSREEELRRERQRLMAQGITAYKWAERAAVMLIPFGGDVYVRAESGAVTRLTETAEPEIDPQICATGERAAFVRGGELYVIDVATRRETKLTKGAPEGVTRGLSDFNGQEEFGEHSGFWIAPTCDKIAYLEVDEREVATVPVMGYRGGKVDLMMQKYPAAGAKNPSVKAGVIDLKTQKTTWLKWPREEERYLGRFAWAADGKALYLQALSRDQKRWALARADASTGEAKEILTDTKAAWAEFAPMRLLEERSPKLLITREVGGHEHLALHDAVTGAEIARLTSGDWDVMSIQAIDEERGRALVSATKDGPTERHLYAVPLEKGGAIQRLTAEPGVHFTAPEHRGRMFVDVHSALDRLPKVALRSEAGAALAELPAPVDAELEALKVRSPEIVEVRGPSGDTLYGALLKPRTMEPGRRYPVVVMVYGGPGEQSVLNFWQPNLLWNHLADRNVIVFQLDNRGSAGRGPAFEAHISGRAGEVELIDQIAGLDHLAKLPFVDKDRVGIHGHSYGGTMTLLAMLKAPDRFKVGVAGSPVTDWRFYDTGYTERYMGMPEKNPSGYDGTAILRLAPNLAGKLLLIHGMMDENVHFKNTAVLIDALVAANKPFDMLILPGERHGFRTPSTRQYVYRRTVEYLTANL
jgi:dipeptidyl-peptidase-4